MMWLWLIFIYLSIGFVFTTMLGLTYNYRDIAKHTLWVIILWPIVLITIVVVEISK